MPLLEYSQGIGRPQPLQDSGLEAWPRLGKTMHRKQQVEWCASTEYNGTCNVVPMTSTPVQRLPESDGLWGTYIGVGGLSIPSGTKLSLGLRIRSSTEQRSDWCWSAETIIGQVIWPGFATHLITPPFQNCNRLIQAGVLRCLQAAPCGTVALGTSGLEGPGRLRP